MKKIKKLFIGLVVIFAMAGCVHGFSEHPNRYYILDFTYMINSIEQNFPYLGIAQRELGVYFNEITENVMEILLDTEIRDAQHFSEILHINFFIPFRQIGHLTIQDRDVLHLILGNIYRGPINYNGEFVYMHDYDITYWGQKFVDMTRSESAQRFYGSIDVDVGAYEAGMRIQNNLTTQILSNSVAYVRVNRFWHYNIDHDMNLMRRFYSQIQEHEHLIIDLRGNGGGFTRYFTQLFMAPNLAYDIEITGINTLIMGGQRNMQWMDVQIKDDYIFAGTTTQLVPIGEFDFVYLQNAYKFDYVVTRPIRVDATGEMLFNGKIWILVDGASASAVEYAAIYAMAANFATVVGEPTRGITGGWFAGFFALPYSGIIMRYDFGYFVDDYGRAVDEFGVIPHYLNMPGKDALETVMYLIENAH